LHRLMLAHNGAASMSFLRWAMKSSTT
jgi:hypothetical protein